MLLPARTAVLNYLYGVKNADIAQIMEALKPIYGGERPFNKTCYLDHVMSLEANGLVSLCKYDLDENGELRMYFEISEDGKATVDKYVDKRYRA
ncbi:hypothetical protein [Lacrimispora sp.]|uniref:hypothetical protein n=1 Tax=Lacrimispora sp. TaxID=2719234 RepID=UPI002FD8CF8E